MKDKKKLYNRIEELLIFMLFVVMVLLDFVPITYIADSLRNRLLSKIIQQTLGSIAGILLLKRLNIKLFGGLTRKAWLYLIPCFIIAIDNFQFSAYYTGQLELIRDDAVDLLLFGGYCASVGLFEECVFRGIIFGVLAGLFPQNKKGFLMTYVVSSVVFGLAHILNGVSIQIAYTVLTGGLFAFCLVKTKNIFCCAAVHAVYNFCGLLFDTEKNLGLGDGIVFDQGTIITMFIVSVLVGGFVLYKIFTYNEEERVDLYEKLAVKVEDDQK